MVIQRSGHQWEQRRMGLGLGTLGQFPPRSALDCRLRLVLRAHIGILMTIAGGEAYSGGIFHNSGVKVRPI